MCRALGFLGLAAIVAALPGAAAQRSPRLVELEARAARESLVPEAHYRLAMGYARAKRHDEAARALGTAIAIDPRYSPAYVALAFQPYRRRPQLAKEERKGTVPLAWRDSLAKARSLLRQAFLIDPLVDLLPPDVEPGADAFATAMVAWSIRRQFGNRPRDSLPMHVLLYRGLANGRGGEYASAIEDFQALLRRSEAMAQDSLVPFTIATNDYRYILAILAERADRPADALGLYRETLGNDLGHYMAHVRLGKLYRQYGMWDDAVVEAQRAVETNPDDPAAVRELGEAFLGAGRLVEAEAALREAGERNPRDMGSLYVLGVILQAVGRGGEARELYDRFLALAPIGLYGPQLGDARRRVAAIR